jgi:hypothetical protein
VSEQEIWNTSLDLLGKEKVVNMIFSPALLLAVLPALTLSAPTAAGSKHNVYLVHCEYTDCDGWDCDPGETSFTAGAFFRDGPIAEGSSTRIQRPTSLTRLSGSQATWEGSKRTIRFGTSGTFTSNISASAKTAAKGSIAGDATLGTEPFVCFKDGATKFRITYDDEPHTCTTDYWCPSVEVGGEVPEEASV